MPEQLKPANETEPLGVRLKRWRLHNNLSQTQAAKEIGVPFRTYQDTERDVSEPEGFGRAFLLKMLAEFEAANPIKK